MIHPPTVLVVEDEALLLCVIADDLREAGFAVIEASNAQQAIRRLETHPEIAVLFTDVDLPGSMDGLGLSAVVRDRWPSVKIIVTSGIHHAGQHVRDVVQIDGLARRRGNLLEISAETGIPAAYGEIPHLSTKRSRSTRPADLGRRHRAMRRTFPAMRVLGCCCGADHRHIAAICPVAIGT